MTDLSTAAHLVNAAREQLDHAERSLFSVLAERGRKPHRKQAACGTPSGYQRHRREDEIPCYACVSAHRWYESRRKFRKRGEVA